MKKALILMLLIFAIPFVMAAPDFNKKLTQAEQQQFDKILEPIMKIYNFIKYAASVIGVVMFVFSGITFVTAGGDMKKKEEAKSRAMYVIVGLIVIWIAPLVVNYIFS